MPKPSPLDALSSGSMAVVVAESLDLSPEKLALDYSPKELKELIEEIDLKIANIPTESDKATLMQLKDMLVFAYEVRKEDDIIRLLSISL